MDTGGELKGVSYFKIKMQYCKTQKQETHSRSHDPKNPLQKNVPKPPRHLFYVWSHFTITT